MSLEEYTTSDNPDHEHAIQTLHGVLSRKAVGRENAMSSEALAELVPVSASTVRDLIPKVRRRYDLPIGSANGYYVVETREELERQVERQKRQAETSRRTAREIAGAWNRTLEDDNDLR